MRTLVLLLVAGLSWLLTGGTAAAQSDERITSFAVEAVIQSDGAVAVTEMITYDFGGNDRHGTEREIVVREPADDEQDRVSS